MRTQLTAAPEFYTFYNPKAMRGGLKSLGSQFIGSLANTGQMSTQSNQLCVDMEP